MVWIWSLSSCGEGCFSLRLAGARVLVSSCGLPCSRETTCTVICRFVHMVWIVVWLSFLLWACVCIFCGVVRVCRLWLACLRHRGCSSFASSLSWIWSSVVYSLREWLGILLVPLHVRHALRRVFVKRLKTGAGSLFWIRSLSCSSGWVCRWCGRRGLLVT